MDKMAATVQKDRRQNGGHGSKGSWTKWRPVDFEDKMAAMLQKGHGQNGDHGAFCGQDGSHAAKRTRENW